MGVTELVLVASPPGDPRTAAGWVRDLAEYWGWAGLHLN